MIIIVEAFRKMGVETSYPNKCRKFDEDSSARRQPKNALNKKRSGRILSQEGSI